ncbi:P-loop containing nucleoside triphosphate hydrolase protein [Mytilinidion resinicola]|uniref:P-loop containing nucleoside triphosphate hydrolase protein n=1 Tax=Mytilinidion resinicola TaxID=574789 RepID=A0A6A6YBK1_9PEZI|nr:P-loop containing nucleoside triphosphate hydrolase protein [Mytilinidion resinicola]KAF2805217.1 P-loop containing nucleoside triphosphate hydrolase protein [Mytilinidion resinicola]
MNLPQEALAVTKDVHLPEIWPSKGAVQYEGVSARYAPGMDPVLRNVSFTVNPNERVGIVGRTGAAKSSLALTLLRGLEAESGHTRIDNVDTKEVGLRDLRRRLAIVPQDPTLFAGTLRFNLDPFSEQSDNEMLAALKSRQLVCIARSLLKTPKIVILDETTASIDYNTDLKIQDYVRKLDSTVIITAHRLRTVIDYDRIVVLDGNEVKECDHPWRLLQNKNGIFHGMCKAASNGENLFSLAEAAWHSDRRIRLLNRN